MTRLKVQRNIQPVPQMRKITTAEEMMPILMGLIEQDQKNRTTEGEMVFAIAVNSKYLKGIDLAERYKLHCFLNEKGYKGTLYERPCLCGTQYELIIPLEYWNEIRDHSNYLKGARTIQEALLKRLRNESIYITLVG